MKIVRHRLYVAYLLTPLLLPYLCFYFCNKLINSDFENSGGIKYFIVKLVWDRPYRNIFCHRITFAFLMVTSKMPLYSFAVWHACGEEPPNGTRL